MPDANDTCLYSCCALARLKTGTQQDSFTNTMIYDFWDQATFGFRCFIATKAQ